MALPTWRKEGIGPDMKAELIVALDVSRTAEALAVVGALPAEVGWYKIGLELFCAEGPAIIQSIRARKKSVFLDLKLHDIPRTVERAVKAAAQHGVEMLTIHSCGGRAMLRAAVDAARSSGAKPPKLIAVTALTSLDQKDLNDLGVSRTPAQQVLSLADLALSCGVDGLVSSPQEVEILRGRFGPRPILVTPGIRLPGEDAGDQKRVATPAAAVKAGANFLVVGRPILEAADSAAAARAILKELG
jgi:orotidine-5'-phosphate decarboxylase